MTESVTLSYKDTADLEVPRGKAWGSYKVTAQKCMLFHIFLAEKGKVRQTPGEKLRFIAQ